MRNFKKFLALVLAMLMVSACAVSVSAFADGAAVKASDYETAINELAALKVIVGDGNGNFNPEDNLTRAEAAVILAKLYSGADGWLIDWTHGTACDFDDVTEKWQFTAINYVKDHKIMTGVGNNQFNPDGIMTVAESLTAAVKADKTSYIDFLNMDDAKEGSAWYTNWVKVARVDGLADELLVANNEMNRPITRAEFVQVIWNLYTVNKANDPAKGIYKGFELNTVKNGALTYDANYVYITESTTSIAQFTIAAFEKAMENFGVAGSYKDYTDGYTFTVKHKAGNYTTVYEMTFAAPAAKNALAVEKVANKTNQLKLDGQVYFISGGASSTIFGIDSDKIINVKLTKADNTVGTFATSADLPAYYAATATKKSNGDFDTLYIQEYAIGTAKADGVIKAAETATVSGKNVNKYVFDDKVSVYDLNNLTNLLDGTKVRDIVFTGKEPVLDNTTPILYRYYVDTNENKIIVDTLEVAATVEGTFKALSNVNGYVKMIVDGAEKTINFAPAGVEAPADAAFEQNIKVFTLGDKYVKVVPASFETVKLYIDKVVMSEDKKSAKVTGYTDKMAVRELNLVGYNDGKLKSAYVWAPDYTAGGKTYAGAGSVEVHTKADHSDTALVTFVEGMQYEFTVLNGVAYVTPAIAANNIATVVGATSTAAVEFSNGFLKIDGVDKAVFTGKIWFKNELKAADDVSAYAQTYGSADTLVKSTGVQIAYNKDANNVCTIIWLDSKGTVATTTDDSKLYALASGETVIFIENATPYEVDYTKAMYKAVDLISGKEIDVSSTSALTAGQYYIAKDGVVNVGAYAGTNASLWFKSTNVTYVKNLKGEVSYTAAQTGVKKTVTVNASGTTTAYAAPDWTTDNKTVASFKANVYTLTGGAFVRALDADGNATTELAKTELTATGSYVAFVTADTMYIIVNG